MKFIIQSTFAMVFIISCNTNQYNDRTSKARISVEPVDLVTGWNQQILEVAEKEDGFLTLKGLRTVTMLHIAMHDALNSTEPRYQQLIYQGSNHDADSITAMTEAAYEIAKHQYPNQHALWQLERQKWLRTRDDNLAKKLGVDLGMAVAKAVLQTRKGDQWNVEADYQWHPMAPGIYAEFNEHSDTPQGFVFGAGWARVKPFVLTSSEQFKVLPPPSINSDAYTRAYDEVKHFGRFKSTVRTDDQGHLALWWKDFAENSHNRLARKLAKQQQLNLAETSRLFALLNMAIFDGYVNVFYNKFLHNHWRPYTAIRWAGNDGNVDTHAELEWTNTHQHTYAFPSYPSAHGTVCASAMTVLAEVFGSDFEFSMTTKKVDKAGPFSEKIEMNPTTRNFDSFEQAAMECSLSRVYLGIHFRYDSIIGNQLGKQIGSYVLNNSLRVVK